MKAQKPPCATILTWLKKNDLHTSALTGHDYAALQAATQVAALWIRGGHEERQQSAGAFARCVRQMQPHTHHLAYHAIAHVADWSHRRQLWEEADLPHLQQMPECTSAPRQ